MLGSEWGICLGVNGEYAVASEGRMQNKYAARAEKLSADISSYIDNPYLYVIHGVQIIIAHQHTMAKYLSTQTL